MNNQPLYDLKGLTSEQLQIISVALEVYARLSGGQFWTAVTEIPNIKKREWNLQMHEKRVFRNLCNAAAQMITQLDSPDASFGLFHSEVPDDARIAYHFHAAIRHQFYLDRGETTRMTVDADPANIVPGLELKIEKHGQISDTTTEGER